MRRAFDRRISTAHRRPWRVALSALLALLQLLATAPAPAQVRLPSMGDSASAGMPLGTERRLGDQIWAEVRRDAAYLDDPVLAAYIGRLWQPLVQAGARRGEIGDDMRAQFAWDAFLIRDRSINAFALPGGYIGVHLGLIAATASRDELVSVLAHELSHVTQRHIARSLETADRQGLVGMAAILLGLIVASRASNPDMAQAAIAGGQAAMIQGQLNFSRDMEREADRIGQALMADAGYQAAGMPAMFDKLDKANRLNDSGAFPYLRSHPLTVERIAEAQARAGLTRTVRPVDDEEHQLMRARSSVLMDPSVQALRAHVEPARASGASAPAWYAGVLAASLLRDEATVRALMASPRAAAIAAAAGPGMSALELLAVEVARAFGPAVLPPPGLRLPAMPVARWSRPQLIHWGQLLLERADAVPGGNDGLRRELQQALRGWLVGQRNDATLWELLAGYEAWSGNRLASLRATAEAHLWSGHLDKAILTLRSARTGARGERAADGVELAVIDARLADLTRLQRAQRAEREGRGGRDARDDPDAPSRP